MCMLSNLHQCLISFVMNSPNCGRSVLHLFGQSYPSTNFFCQANDIHNSIFKLAVNPDLFLYSLSHGPIRVVVSWAGSYEEKIFGHSERWALVRALMKL